LTKSPIAVPPSLKVTFPPSASSIISPPISSVKSPLSEIVEPLIVISSTVRVDSVPRLVIFVCAAVDKVPAILPVTVKSPPIEASSVTVKSSCTFKSTTLRLANASTTAAPEPAPSE